MNEKIFRIWAKLVFALALLSVLASLAGCSTEVDKVRHNLSDEADNINIQRRLTVINNRTDKIVFEMEGTFALDVSKRGELEVTCEVAKGEYKRHFIHISDETIYVMEDISGANSDPYHYELNFLPEWGVKVTHDD